MKPSKPIRVFIVDDHDLLRVSLTIFFETCDDLSLVGEATSGEEAVEKCIQLQPDVAIVDLHLPGMDGIETARLIRQHCANTRVLMLTYLIDEDGIAAAIAAGASGYLLKDVSIDELADAVRTVVER
jgi:DNA-binding NarL/FixJ family response regulator